MRISVQLYGIEGWVPAHVRATGSELLDNLAAFYVIALAGKIAHGIDNTALIQQQAMLQNVEAR